MKLKEIAERIHAHLKRFEADPVINAPSPTWKTRPYYCVNTFVAGSRIGISYINYQARSTLTKADAERYLAWLDSGNVGRHYRSHYRIKDEVSR